VTAGLGRATLQMGVVALSASLIARWVVKREFLFHRGVRVVAATTLVAVVALNLLAKEYSWAIVAAVMIVGLGSRWIKATSRLPWLLAAQAVLVGAYFGESFGSLIELVTR
jgi:hypothetical protein